MDPSLEYHSPPIPPLLQSDDGLTPEAREAARLEAAAERWHELLTCRYVCEACLTRYFMKYRACKACGKIGRIQLLTATLVDLADNETELREMIANGQRILFK